MKVKAMNRLGLIDIGTNTLRLLIGETGENQVPRFVFQKVLATRLGEGLSAQDQLTSPAIHRTIAAVSELQKLAFEHGIKTVEAYATAWARKAANTEEVLSALASLNVPVWILTAGEEAAMGLEAVKLMDASLADFWMIDIGGGSTEIIQVVANKAQQMVSIPLGAVNVTESFFKNPPDETKIVQACSEIEKKIVEKVSLPQGDQIHVVALGGTVATLAALKLKIKVTDPQFFLQAQNQFLQKSWIEQELEVLLKLSVEDRKKLPGMEQERADILPAGILILDRLLSMLNAHGITVCLFSFIHGLMAKRLEVFRR